MTPLAARIMKACIRDERKYATAREMLDLLSDIHCFETTEVLPFFNTLAELEKNLDDPEDIFRGRVFLPAPKTWIEFRLPGASERTGMLLIDNPRAEHARAILWFKHGAFEIGWISTRDATYFCNGAPVIKPADQANIEVKSYLGFVHILLVLINTPRIIGRRQHMPNGALERRLMKRQNAVGKYPLHAWNEIKLEINKPIEIDDGEPHEAHITGKRALHFCRAHLRIKNGMLEYVTSHWRGDAAIGIKRTRYKLTV